MRDDYLWNTVPKTYICFLDPKRIAIKNIVVNLSVC